MQDNPLQTSGLYSTKPKTNLLGLPDILFLNLIARIHLIQMTDSKESVIKEFPNLFCGLDNMAENYEICLR